MMFAFIRKFFNFPARAERFELPSTVLETAILPLNYARMFLIHFSFLERPSILQVRGYFAPDHSENYAGKIGAEKESGLRFNFPCINFWYRDLLLPSGKKAKSY
jgi:hypothetical protein